MAALTCPYCNVAIPADEHEPAERCPACAGELLIAYRYRLVATRGEVAGGMLYEAVDAGFGQQVAVLFVADASDHSAVTGFVDGHRLFANMRARGLIGIHEVARTNHPRPHIVMDWLAGSTLDRVVQKQGALDPEVVWSMASDLLLGLERAHRALPAIVHGQVHPGKIGFRKPLADGGQVALFGFEYARLVAEQDSALADSFTIKPGDLPLERASSLDLRALARTIIYAATGRWIEDGTMARQREQAGALMAGPFATVLDRLLAAGTPDGYMSTSVARDDFEVVRHGGHTRRHRPAHLPPMGTAPFAAGTLGHHDDDHHHHDDPNDEDDEDDEFDESDQPDEPEQPVQPRSRATVTPPNTALLEQIRQRQAQVVGVPPKPAGAKSGRLGLILVTGLLGMCSVAMVVGISEGDEVSDRSVQKQAQPISQVQAVVPAAPEFVVPIEPSSPAISARRWAGEVDVTSKGPLRAGSKCEIWVGPTNDGSAYNCVWALDCNERGRGWTRYYGNSGSGFGKCELDADGRVVHVEDAEDNDGDGTFVFETRAEQPFVVFGDHFADPARALVIRFSGEGEAADQPSQASPRVLERRGEVSEEETAAYQAELARVTASIEWPLPFGAPPDPDADPFAEELPDELDIFALQAAIASLDANDCPAPPGTEVQISLTLSGRTGKVSSVELTDTIDSAHARCLTGLLKDVAFGRFANESMSVEWTMSW